MKCEAYCNKALKCDNGYAETCELTKPVNCDVDCNPAGFLAPTFLSVASILFFVYRTIFH